MRKKLTNYTFTAVLEPDEDGWFISVPELSKYACYSQGDTIEEAVTNIKEVIEMTVEEIEANGNLEALQVHNTQKIVQQVTVAV
jgi:predicted RNase H-like HicB family nuclease